MDLGVYALLAAAAFLTSAVSGFLGMAGGISLLGVMTAVLPAGQVVPLHGAVQLASNFTRTAVFLRHVAWRIFLAFALPVAAGAALAASLWSGEKLHWFRPAIGAFLLAFLAWRRRAPRLRNVPLWTYPPLGFCAGFLAIFVGSVGPFIAPFFLRDDFANEQVIATKAVCQTWTHFLKIPAFLALGFPFHRHAGLIGLLLVCVVLGTLTGKKLLGMISKERFTRVYEGVLAVIAFYLILGGRGA